MLFSVSLMNQVSKLQLNAHRIVRAPLIATFRRGFRPMKQCRKIVKVSATTEARDAVKSCVKVSCAQGRQDDATVTHPDEGPWLVVVLMLEMPHEVCHDRANDQAGHELEEPQGMEGDTWVVARSRLCSAVEHHLASCCTLKMCCNEVKMKMSVRDE